MSAVETVFNSQFEVRKIVNVKTTVSDYELGANVNTTHTPANIINNDNFDPSKRWTVYGNNNFIDFEFDQQLKVYGIDIAWYQGNEFRYTFKITASGSSEILFNGVSTVNMGSYELYKLKTPVTTKNIRIYCNGNLADEWTRVTAIRFRLDPIPENEATVKPFPDCPEGQHWHEGLQKCVSDVMTQPPNVIITDPIQTVRHGDNVLIDASQTTDPTGSNIFYEWTQIGGETVKTGSTLQPNIVFKAPTVDSELKFRVTVTNVGSLSATKDATVVVRAAIPQCPPGQVWDEDSKQCVKPQDQQEPAVKKPKKSRKHKWPL